MVSARLMHMGVFVLGTGNHISGWRHPGATTSFQDLAVIQRIAQTAERGCFDLLFLGDSLKAGVYDHPSFTARFEPLTMLAALVPTTRWVGLGATSSTTYGAPFTVARAFASLDHLSGGRAAWNAVTSSHADNGGNFGMVHPPHERRYAIADEFVDVVRGLWDCWDDDAIVADRASGLYIDPQKVRELNHNGTYFQVRGPLNIGRCPQGHPVILQAGASAPGQQLAARTADVVFSVVQDLQEAQAAYARQKGLLRQFGRNEDSLKILPGVMPIIGRTRQEALDLLSRLQSYANQESALTMLGSRLGQDLSGFDLDAPVPDFPLPNASHGFAGAMLAKARRDGLSLRELAGFAAAARGHLVLCDTPAGIADTLEEWFMAKAADGFNVLPPFFPGAFDDFVDLVIPELQRRGLFRKRYTGTTLRDHFGFARPAHQGSTQ